MIYLKHFFSFVGIFFGIISCNTSSSEAQTNQSKTVKLIMELQDNVENNKTDTIDTAIFAAGCFWCVEGQFLQLKGVQSVKSGYIGGEKENPTYEEVCTGTTGHAEAVRIIFNPQLISYESLLAAFFISHDPTQLNRQGNDIGTQYRSAIFPINEHQKSVALLTINKLNEAEAYSQPIVTQVESIATFYEAETYHDNYFERNPQNPYCQMVVKPKIEKFKQVFAEQLK